MLKHLPKRESARKGKRWVELLPGALEGSISLVVLWLQGKAESDTGWGAPLPRNSSAVGPVMLMVTTSGLKIAVGDLSLPR